MSKITKDTIYTSSLTAKRDGEIETSFATQPYLTGGMYIAISIPGQSMPIQQSQSHKSFAKWVKGSIKLMEKNGLVVETTERTYGDWFTEEEIKEYLNN